MEHAQKEREAMGKDAFGSRWFDASGRSLGAMRRGALAIAVAATAALPAVGIATPSAGAATSAVIVQERPGAGNGPEGAVTRLGGSVERQLPLIDGFSARLPQVAVATLRRHPGVRVVTVNETLRPMSFLEGTTYDQVSTTTSLYTAARRLDADDFWKRGYTGSGIDVAIIDTGVSKVKGLHGTGRVLDGPDLSFESQDPARRYVDNFGHGTHLAGIIAGNDIPGSSGSTMANSTTAFLGIAPDARIVNMKVGDGNGVTDVSQVIAAVDWVVANRNQNGLNIRVLELAYGTDSTNPYQVDPLVFALEQAWKSGIFVVVSSGNGGKTGPRLASPAISPNILAVGAAHPNGSVWEDDDYVADFSSSKGTSTRGPDLIAYGVSIPSLRVPGSKIDVNFGAGGNIGSRFLKGSGTSQASAVAAGAAALILQQRPTMSPDALRAMLMANANPVPNEPYGTQGAGRLDIDLTPEYGFGTIQTFTKSTGLGSIDASRGTRRPSLDGVEISGEIDIFGNAWDPAGWTALSTLGRAWNGGDWLGRGWAGSGWAGSSWAGRAWNGRAWNGRAWSGSAWAGSGWNGQNFLGSSWATSAWR
jgi:serine protease AprX